METSESASLFKQLALIADGLKAVSKRPEGLVPSIIYIYQTKPVEKYIVSDMKSVVFLCLIAYASAFYSYLDKVDDVEKLMSDRERVKSVMDCVLDRGPCTELGLDHKKHILGSMMSFCADCEPKEKHKLEVTIQILRRDYPQLLADFRKKYDLDGKHFDVIESDLLKY